MKLGIALFGFASVFWLPSQANDIYKWTDENGHINMSDTVPDKYKNSARKIGVNSDAVTADQRQESQLRAEREKALLAEAKQRREREEAANTTAVLKDKSKAPVNENADCATLQKRYQESQECYAPFHIVSGAMRPGAVDACGPAVDNPTAKCGSPIWK